MPTNRVSNFIYFFKCNLCVFGQLVMLTLEVVENYVDFMELILVYTLCTCSILCYHSIHQSNMAVVISRREAKSPSISDVTEVNSDFKCICCNICNKN
jgi:hypothetical protein